MKCPACGSTNVKIDKRPVQLQKLYARYEWSQMGWLCECAYLFSDAAQREANAKAYHNAPRIA